MRDETAWITTSTHVSSVCLLTREIKQLWRIDSHTSQHVSRADLIVHAGVNAVSHNSVQLWIETARASFLERRAERQIEIIFGLLYIDRLNH